MLITSDRNLSPPPLRHLSSTARVEEDRRVHQRAHRRMDARVATQGRSELQQCVTENISEGGLFLRVPVECGLDVGQRCEVVLNPPGARLGGASNGEAPVYATVVRTERSAEPVPMLGVGMRFDQPLYL